jgi:hypothetical protein
MPDDEDTPENPQNETPKLNGTLFDIRDAKSRRREYESRRNPDSLLGRLDSLIESLPAGEARIAFQQWRKDFDYKLEVIDWMYVDEIPIDLSVCEDLLNYAKSIESLQSILSLAPENSEARSVAQILRPMCEHYEMIIRCEGPKPDFYRKRLEELGLADQIRGG